MNTSETDHALRKAVFQTAASGTLPDTHQPESLQTNLGHSPLDSGLQEAPDSLDFNNHSQSFMIIHNKNSERSEEPSPFPQKGLGQRAKSVATCSFVPLFPDSPVRCKLPGPSQPVRSHTLTNDKPRYFFASRASNPRLCLKSDAGHPCAALATGSVLRFSAAALRTSTPAMLSIPSKPKAPWNRPLPATSVRFRPHPPTRTPCKTTSVHLNILNGATMPIPSQPVSKRELFHG